MTSALIVDQINTTAGDAYVTAGTNPVTGGGISLRAGGDSVLVAPVGAVATPWQLNPRALSVMTAPPTVTTNTTNTLAAGTRFSTVNGAGSAPVVGNSSISFFRGAYYRQQATGYPDYLYANADTITSGAPSPYGNLVLQYSFIHTGSRFSLSFKGSGAHLLIKVDGAFVAMTPIVVASDGNLYYSLVDFGSVATRRIDVIGSSLLFGGVYTDSTDSVTVAPMRGPRMVVLSDSFGDGAGNEVSPLFSWITYLAEYLGWDDVVASAVGTTGLLAGTLPKVPFGTRAPRDVAALSPALVWVAQSVNDSGQTAAAVLAAAQALVTTINNAGCYPKFVFSSPSINTGAGYITTIVRAQQAAVKAWCAIAGHMYVDDIELPFDVNYTPHVTTLSSGATEGATVVATVSPLIPGATYKWADGTTMLARTGTSVDFVRNTQTAGATLTECGATYLSGAGRVGAPTGFGSADVCVSTDTTHPTNRGHRLKGYTDAAAFIRLQSPARP